MGIDIINIFRLHPGHMQGIEYGLFYHPGSRIRSCDVIGIGVRCIPYNLCIDFRIPFDSVFEAFKNQDPCPFTNDKAISVFVKGSARSLGVFIPPRQRLHVGERTCCNFSKNRLAPSGYDDIKVAQCNILAGVNQGI